MTTWPGAGTDNDAVFGGTAGTVTLTGGVTANDLTFNSNGYTIQGNTLTLNGGAVPSITVAAGLGATLGPVITGNAGLTKTGAGSLTLTGAAPRTPTPGSATVNQGVLYLNKTAGLAATSGAILMTGGNQPEIVTLAANQFAPGTTIDTTGATNWERFSLMGNAQTVSAITDPAGRFVLGADRVQAAFPPRRGTRS
ncbi:MAG: hypothetical protein U1F77_11865 [Kiritimatiellia bacterium]